MPKRASVTFGLVVIICFIFFLKHGLVALFIVELTHKSASKQKQAKKGASSLLRVHLINPAKKKSHHVAIVQNGMVSYSYYCLHFRLFFGQKSKRKNEKHAKKFVCHIKTLRLVFIGKFVSIFGTQHMRWAIRCATP